jgi:hypothetical protein
MMPLTKQQIAIKCYYEGRRKPSKPPRDRMVLDGNVKLTPRRREILFHIACTNDIRWRVEKNWINRWANNKIFVPYLGATAIPTIVRYLMRKSLVRYSKDAPTPTMAATNSRWLEPPILIITPRGADALLETVGGL